MTRLRAAVKAAIARLPGLAGPAFIAIGEGAWVTVVYLLLEAAAAGSRPLGIVPFSVAAAAGIVVGIRTRTDPDRVRLVSIGLVVVGLFGWLATDTTLGRLGTLDLGGAIGAHPGGPLLALAALRGVLRGGGLADVGVGDDALGGPAVVVGIAWVLGGALAEPVRSSFASEALGPTVAFVIAGPAGAALSRVAELARVGGFGWTANRAWLGLLAAVSLVFAGAAILGAAGGLDAMRGIAPLLVILALAIVVAREPAPSGRPSKRRNTIIAWLIVFAVIGLVVFLPTPPPRPQNQPPAAATATQQGDADGRQGGTFLLVVGLGIGAAVALYVLRRRWVSPRGARSEIDDDRLVEVDWHGFTRVGGWRPRRSHPDTSPTGAVGAYRAALAALATDLGTRRSPGETPAAHARRLRGDGTGGLALDLLAADYSLVRFGGADLTSAEERRAMSRWSRIRGAAERRVASIALARIATTERGGEGGAVDRSEAKDSATGSRDSSRI
jgi:Domain of unknown function (DUF4129)